MDKPTFAFIAFLMFMSFTMGLIVCGFWTANPAVAESSDGTIDGGLIEWEWTGEVNLGYWAHIEIDEESNPNKLVLTIERPVCRKVD